MARTITSTATLHLSRPGQRWSWLCMASSYQRSNQAGKWVKLDICVCNIHMYSHLWIQITQKIFLTSTLVKLCFYKIFLHLKLPKCSLYSNDEKDFGKDHHSPNQQSHRMYNNTAGERQIDRSSGKLVNKKLKTIQNKKNHIFSKYYLVRTLRWQFYTQ